MSEEFYNPYQFIPPNGEKSVTVVSYKTVQDLKKADNKFVRHDYWHADGVSGRITCQLSTKSAVFVGAEQKAGSKENKMPGVAEIYRDHNNFPAIPANSLRGMVSNVAEIISGSTLRVLLSEKDGKLSVRKPAKGGSGVDGALSNLGILKRYGDSWKIHPLSNPINVNVYGKNISDEDKEHLKIIESEKCFQSNKKDYPNEIDGIYYVRGKVGPKKIYEQFIPNADLPDLTINDINLIAVPESVVTSFEYLLRESYQAIVNRGEEKLLEALLPYGYFKDENNRNFELDGRLICDGDMMYYRVENEEIVELSFSTIWRRHVPGTVRESFKAHYGENSVPWNEKRSSLTAAEALFGVVEEIDVNSPDSKAARNLASRVRFYDATSSSEINLHKPVVLKALSSPKLPCPVMYFCASGAYVDNFSLDLNENPPNGRKFYLPHPESLKLSKFENGHWESKTKDRDWLKLSCQPIPKDERFTFKIHFENLSSDELSLLLIALQPTDENNAFIHRLGLGKPIGLGHVTIDAVSVSLIDRKSRYTTKPSHVTRQNLESPLGMLKASRNLIHNESFLTLCEIANPVNVGNLPVCYPYANGQSAYDEVEGYKWFEANTKNRQVLHRSNRLRVGSMNSLKTT